MIKTLTAVGNSLGLIIDKPILEILGIDEETRLEVRTDGEGLIIRPVREERPSAVAATLPPSPVAAPSSPPAAADGDLDLDLDPALDGDLAGALDGDLDLDAALDGDLDLDDEILRDMAALDDEPDVSPSPPAPAPPPPASAPAPVSAPAAPAPPLPPAAAAPPPPPPGPALQQPVTSSGAPVAPSRSENGESPSLPSSSSGSAPVPARTGTAPEIVVEQKGDEVLRIKMTGPELVIGREHTADVHLDDRALSRKHAKIEKRGAALWVQDLGSANGTYVNGEKVSGARPLQAGDVIGVGHYRVRIEGATEAGEKTPVLTLKGPEGTHRFALVGDQIVIGRSQSCDISIGHKSISRRHVRLSREGDAFFVHDLGSQNGCKLNGAPLTGSASFGLGDRLDVCEFTLTLGFLDEESGEEEAEADDEAPKPRRPRTMLIDKSAMAQAAYVDGDFENVRSRQASPPEEPSKATKADTGEHEGEGDSKKPRVVRPRARR